MLRALRVACLAAPVVAAPAQPPPAPPQRVPVLSQVRVPHGYYWREMYVPQVTSGPSAASWSPDGGELVYSMQGTLWRQRVGSTQAEQLTDGPGYDFQPDWSPDGRHVVYTAYDGRALSLRVVDMTTGDTATLLADGAVNVEPRWSPDGARLAFVSSAHEGRWHVFVADVDRRAVAAGSGSAAVSLPRLRPAVRITEDRDSGLPRYYYGVHDQWMSPSWSPDGRELIVVSNRGRVHGSGGFWRLDATPGAEPREIHYEETTWKARPDWSPDGTRLVYASYLGRQWHGLWMLPARGGDPVQFTYGEHDAVAPRWSPDGRRIAYVSNETGNTSLWVLDVIGGARTRIEARTRRYRAATTRLILTVLDSAGRARMPARISVRGADGRFYAPDDAMRHVDEALVPAEQRFEHGYWASDGHDTLTVPAGPVSIEVWRGPEFEVTRREIDLRRWAERRLGLTMRRHTDMAARGWFGGDLHVHMNYGGTYRNTPARLALQARAEGLYLVENLIVNKEQRIPDIAYWRPDPDPVSTRDFVLAHGQEFHTVFWGHLGLLGMRDHYLLPDYAGYPRTALASLAPSNETVAKLARAQGGLVGYVHPFDFRPDLSRLERGVPYALPADVALGNVDYYEVMGFSDHLASSEIWYRLLNCGFRLPAGAGTDAFPNFAAMRGPPGVARVYVHGGGTARGLDHRRWLDALRAGQTMVTNAPLLGLTVRAGAGPWREPGDELRLPPGRQRLTIRATLRSSVPVEHLELVSNGSVIATIPAGDGGTRADTVMTVDVERSGWLVLRARGDRPRLPVLDLHPFASTSPVYVQLGDAPTRSATDADYFIRWLDLAAESARQHAGWNTPAERDETLAMLAAARAEFVKRR